MSSGTFDLSAAIRREEAPIRFVRQLCFALRTRQLRGPSDPRSREAVETLESFFRDLSAEGEPILLYRTGPHLFLNHVGIRPTPENRLQVRSLWQDLDRLGIGGFRLEPDLPAGSLEVFLDEYPRLDQALEEAGVLRSVRADSIERNESIGLEEPSEETWTDLQVGGDRRADPGELADASVAAGAHARADSDGQSEVDGHAAADTRTESGEHADTDEQADADSWADSDGRADARGQADAAGQADADRHADSVAWADSDGHADAGEQADAAGQVDTDGHADADARADSDAHADTDGQTDLAAPPVTDARPGAGGHAETRPPRATGGRRLLEEEWEWLPGVTVLPHLRENLDVSPTETDRRAQARQAFYRALGASRHIFRQSQDHRISELRKSRAAVHSMVDILVEEECTLLGLSAIQDFDPYTFQHSVHVSVLSMAMGQRLGLPRGDLAYLGVAAMFHDVGKTRVPVKVLRKPGSFDGDEWRIMRRHPLSGARELLRFGGMSDLAVRVMLVSAEHHMRFDGSGYPRVEAAWQQGLFSRIVTIADCFDAMTASRIYMKRPFTPDAVIRYMVENAGRMFDPDLLRVFVGLVGRYPVGSMVRLESGELAAVAEPPSTPEEVERPRVRLLISGPDGTQPGEDRSLAAGSPSDPRYGIRAGCHPQEHGIRIDDLLTRFYLDAA